MPHPAPTYTCLVTGQPVSNSDSIALETLRPGLQELILVDFPQAAPDARVSQDALVDYRRKSAGWAARHTLNPRVKIMPVLRLG